jgi:hypothetical protein
MGLFGKKKSTDNKSSSIPPPVPGPNNMNVSDSFNNQNNDFSSNSIPPPPAMDGMPNMAPPKMPEMMNMPNFQNENNMPRPEFSGEKMANMKVPNYDNVSGESIEKYNQLNIPKPPTSLDNNKSNNNFGNEYDFSLPNINIPKENNVNTIPNKEIEVKEDKKVSPMPVERVSRMRDFNLKPGFDKYTDNDVLDRVKKDYSIIPEKKGPLFVEINSYKHVLDGIDYIKGKLKESDDLIIKTEEIEDYKKTKFEDWKANLEDIQRKFVFMQKTLFDNN